MSCALEIKTLKGEFSVVENISIETTVEDLYNQVAKVETTPDGKWKLMIIVRSPRTLKPIQDKDKQLKEYGAEDGSCYRVEVILDMGACHTSCRRS